MPDNLDNKVGCGLAGGLAGGVGVVVGAGVGVGTGSVAAGVSTGMGFGALICVAAFFGYVSKGKADESQSLKSKSMPTASRMTLSSDSD